MLVLTEDAKLVCMHQAGVVEIEPSQVWVTIDTRLVLVSTDPEDKAINGCPNINVGIRPCKNTLKVKKGYSTWVRIDEDRVCLDSVEGLTDGTPSMFVKYIVEDPGQMFVSEAG
ncbi:MAG: hypothetical protein GEU71_05215 [Actinobacteria bacterium]|nr:hypothetical protein [Actinomycetota bacterium]